MSSYRRTFLKDVTDEQTVLAQRFDDLQALLEDRIGAERARGEYLDQVTEAATKDLGEIVATFNKLMGRPSTGDRESDVRTLVSENADAIEEKNAELMVEFAPFLRERRAAKERTDVRFEEARAASQDFVTKLPERSAEYRRQQLWLAVGWIVVAVGAVFNMLVAAQAY